MIFRSIAAAVMLAVTFVAADVQPARAHTDWSPAPAICELVTVAHFENVVGYNWNRIRETDFVFLDRFWVGCTIYPAPGGQPMYERMTCFVYDRTGHGLYFVGCPTPP